jgi:hypothetical protein
MYLMIGEWNSLTFKTAVFASCLSLAPDSQLPSITELVVLEKLMHHTWKSPSSALRIILDWRQTTLLWSLNSLSPEIMVKSLKFPVSKRQQSISEALLDILDV